MFIVHILEVERRRRGGKGDSERGQMQRPKLIMQRTCITRLAGSDAFLVCASWWCNNQGVCLLDAPYIL